MGDLQYLIQEIVRDEVARELGKPATSPEPYVSRSIRALIQEQVTAAIPCPAIPPTMPMPLEPTYAEMVARPPPMPVVQPQQPFPPPRWQGRRADIWRTPENRPICFSCGLVGYVARFCRHRYTESYDPPPQAHYRPGFAGSRRSDAFQDYSDYQRQQQPSRSPSPSRRSLSPIRPRTTSPAGSVIEREDILRAI